MNQRPSPASLPRGLPFLKRVALASPCSRIVTFAVQSAQRPRAGARGSGRPILRDDPCACGVAISTRLFTGPEHRTGRRTRAGGYERRVKRRGKTSGGSQAWKISFIETLFLRVSAGPQSTSADHARRVAQVPPPIGYEPVLWPNNSGKLRGGLRRRLRARKGQIE